MRLSDLGELGLLAELERRGLAREIGNDAAQLGHGLVVTQDALVEGVHFRLDWLSWRDLGWRAAAANLSDLAASGAEPEGLVVTLAAPGDTYVDDVLELYGGMAETGVPVVGGDTTESERLVLSVSALGRSDRVPGRAGARAGDLLVVTGPLGAAGVAFRAQAFVRPPLRLHEGKELAATAHALLDLSGPELTVTYGDETGATLLTERWTTLKHITLSPGRIGDLVAAALVLVHFEHGRIT